MKFPKTGRPSCAAERRERAILALWQDFELIDDLVARVFVLSAITYLAELPQ